MTTPDLGHLITAMVTPFAKDGSVDLERAGQLAKKLLDEGSDGILVTGTTGESPTLSHEEKVALWEHVVDAVGDQAAVLAGSGTYDTAESVALSREAERVGVHGILLVTPYYSRPSQEGLFRHMASIADSVKLPVMLYNVPGRTSVNILPETVMRLTAACANITSVKEASGDIDQIAEIIRTVPKGFKVYSGDDKLTLPVLAIGGVGVVSVASHVAGTRIREMLDTFEAGHNRKAHAIHLQLLPLFRGLFRYPSPVPVKTALRLMGFDAGGVRLPMVPLTAEEEAWLTKLLRDVKLL